MFHTSSNISTCEMEMHGTSFDKVLPLSESRYSMVLRIGKWVLNVIFHLCVAVLAVYTMWLPIKSYTWPFSWHVILCTLGIFPLVTESLIIFSKQKIWSQEIDRKQKHWIHVILTSIGGFLILAGVGFEIYRKVVHTDPTVKHFESSHSITGLIGIIFILHAMVCGVLAFNTQRIYRWNRKARPIYSKLIHNVLGLAAYLFCLISFCLGYFTTPWFVKNLSEASRITATIVTIIVGIWSMICAWRSFCSKITYLRNV